jgi:hypothetical protein
VGSIQTKDSRLFISGSQGSNPAGIYFGGGGDVLPASTTNAVDNSISLGGTGYRWKDLYLSGGVHLGGTGSANKLDDYEEGTFTPFLSALNQNPTYTQQTGRYTKTGRWCNVFMRIATSSFNSGTGLIKFGGLPFTQINGVYHIAQIFSLFGFEDYAGDIIAQFNTGTTNFELYSQAAGAGANYIAINNTHLHGNGTGQPFMVTIQGGYEVQ